MQQIIVDIRQSLRDHIDEKTRLTGRRVFKEEIEFYGVRIPEVHRIAREYFSRIDTLPKAEIFGLCEWLWQSGYNEEHYIACDWSYWIHERFEAGDFGVFERWVDRYVNNWASCDTLCNHTVGEFVEQFPDYVEQLKRWAQSENRWMRRGAAVTLIIPARKGLFPGDVFEIAEILLRDPDDLVQKGYGWMLKAAGEKYPEEVFRFVMSRKSVMPRTAFRYAIEKLPPALREKAMEK